MTPPKSIDTRVWIIPKNNLMESDGRAPTQAEVQSAAQRNILIGPNVRVFESNSDKNKGRLYFALWPGKKWINWVEEDLKVSIQDVYKQNQSILEQLQALRSDLETPK